MNKAPLILPLATVLVFTGLVLAVQQIGAWEAAASAQPLRIVASNF